MAEENGREGKRPTAQITITWDPETGELKMAASGMNPMEELGVIELASHIRRNSMTSAPSAGRIIRTARTTGLPMIPPGFGRG